MAENRFGWILLYGLVVLFVLGIIELLIIPAIEAKFIPSLIDSMNGTMNSTDLVAYAAQVATVIKFMDAAMYVLMFIVIVYMIISIFKKEEQIQQY